MKKLSVFFAAAIVAATVSAFTTKVSADPFYIDETGVHSKIGLEGICVDAPFACEYTYKGTGDPSDPSNYNEVAGTEDLVFRPDDNSKK
ncbi:MAG: hypothetical protein V4450_13670 [Bacteroidota bacterium]